MPTLTNSFLLLTAMALASSIPGPDMLSIIARSTGQGRYAGILSCLGIAMGGLVQTCVVALGLSSVFLLVPIVYETMKGIGAIYLIYVGTRTLFSQQEAWADPGQEKAGAPRVFLQGTFTTLLNPKAAFFYFALLPQFVDPTQGNEPLQLFMLGLLANMTGLAIESSIAYLASCFRKWLKAYVGTSKMLRWFTGSVFIGLGARLALSQ